jgi:hypothetical protein
MPEKARCRRLSLFVQDVLFLQFQLAKKTTTYKQAII